MALLFSELGAPDVALTEAVLGADLACILDRRPTTDDRRPTTDDRTTDADR